MIEKAIWTDADFDVMGWHDCPIRAVAIDLSEGVREIALDLDYIVEWVKPDEAGGAFKFSICPATLVFHEVWSLEGDLSMQGPFLELDAINREQDRSWTKWTVQGHYFEWTLHATGFTQWLRKAPQQVPRQDLLLEERGGLSFERAAFDSR